MSRPWLRALPNGKPISALGFGVSSLMAKVNFNADRAQELLETAAARGINHFDTSPSYGVGHGETRLARFLADRDPARLVISTKVGSNLIGDRVVRGFDRDTIARSFDASMRRLGVAHVDILYLHGPTEADLADPVFRFFNEQKAAGRITYAGVNSFTPAVLDRCVASPIDAVMLQYNAGDFSQAAQMRALHAAGKIVISGTALARATYDWRAFVPRDWSRAWYLARMLRHDPLFLVKGRRLGARLSRVGPPHATAVRFVTAQPEITSNLFGTTNPAHVAANAAAGHTPLDPADHARLAA